MNAAPIDQATPEGRALVARARRLHGWRPRGVPAPIGHRMRRWRLSRLRRQQVLCTLDGNLRFVADLADPIQCILCENGEWEGKIWDAVCERLNAGDVAVDVGAHAGYSVLRIAQAVGASGHVHAFEPVEALRKQTQANVDLNDLSDRVTLHPEAVSNCNGTATLFHDPLESAGMSSLVSQRFLRETFEVRTVFLDSWLSARSMEQVALVKIDVEGAEGLVIDGVWSRMLDQRIDTLLVEVHLHVLAKQGDPGGKEALAPIREAGYEMTWWSDAERFEASGGPPDGGVAYLLASRPGLSP